jgi:hypothetical protein
VTTLRVGIVLVLAVAATVVANVVLLGVATGSSEPVGKLTPRAVVVPASVRPRPVQTLPVRPRAEPEPGERSDD